MGCSMELPDLRDIPKHFAVGDPLSGHSVLLPKPGAGLYLGSYCLGAALVISDKDERDIFSFEVLMATYIIEEGPCLCAFSSSRQWAVLPCPDTEELYSYGMPWINDGARAGGCVYWVVHDWEMGYEHILVLTPKPRSSPPSIWHAAACVRSTTGTSRSRSAKGRWLKEDVVKFSSVDGWIDLLTERGSLGGFSNGYAPRIVDAVEGFVFIKRYEALCVFVLNLKEMTMQKLPDREEYYVHALPYRMALSSPLPNFNQEGNR
ncbi:hypothetical protein BAE44_0003917 [Dichanthelium oligosanthes]|uniref:Uncharacterized protein n=1 Tax=Dichanthelium oligosanthes TaxID=888268 RepID=A0A1E5WCL3_9POAL|nr:hypothetical protein BAE44_0003917 [Dichanthelium oligosanthes]